MIKGMKSLSFILIFVFTSIILFAQNQINQSDVIQRKQVFESSVYKLFPTQNYWTFIKLDTQNGKMWQVHFTIEKDGVDGQLILNPTPLVSKDKEVNGRFNLYPTNNVFNFLLLDQLDGSVFQVQWSMEKEYRGVIPID